MIKYILVVFTVALLAISCKREHHNADSIISKSIEVSGGAILASSIVEFDFRDIHYRAVRSNGSFNLERYFENNNPAIPDTIVAVKDVLSHIGFQRFVNTIPITIPDSMAVKYSASVNSVHYFSVLPYGLFDSAVKRSYLGEIKIKEQPYYKIKVTFNKEGGGEDFDDVFLYWIHTETFKPHYLAYSSKEKNNTTAYRFRVAYNERFKNGVRFVDYNNYKPKNDSIVLEDIDYLYTNNQLELLSKIELKNVSVTTVLK